MKDRSSYARLGERRRATALERSADADANAELHAADERGLEEMQIRAVDVVVELGRAGIVPQARLLGESEHRLFLRGLSALAGSVKVDDRATRDRPDSGRRSAAGAELGTDH